MIQFAISGATGRMGRSIINLAAQKFSGEIVLKGAIEHSASPHIGQDAGEISGSGKSGVIITSNPIEAVEKADVVIDFSTPEHTLALGHLCEKTGKALVVGTTGFSAKQRLDLLECAKKIPLIISPNMSPGVNLLFHLTAIAAKALSSWDIEILEAHHRFKKDAPSGTAVRLKEILLRELQRSEDNVNYGRKGITGERNEKEIGVHAIRGGDVVGDHTVYFLSDGERLELTHRAFSRDTFAAGALRAALFLAGRAPGEYTMRDVLQIG